MEIGIDSFAAVKSTSSEGPDNVTTMKEVLQRIEQSDKSGLDIFGLGEHHRKDFLDSAAHMILAAASQRTKNI